MTPARDLEGRLATVTGANSGIGRSVAILLARRGARIVAIGRNRARLEELAALQDRRNVLARFPDQTKDCPPLADHTLFIGERPKIKPIPVLLRGRLHSPIDNTPMRVSAPDPSARANGRPDIKRLVPDC